MLLIISPAAEYATTKLLLSTYISSSNLSAAASIFLSSWKAATIYVNANDVYRLDV
jgi:hypothetical protein